MSRSVGRAGRVFVTAVRAGWFRARSSTDRSHWTARPTATFSSVAHNQFTTSSSICEAQIWFDSCVIVQRRTMGATEEDDERFYRDTERIAFQRLVTSSWRPWTR